MKKIIYESLRILVALLFTLPFAQPALAHGGEPRLEISVGRINPGGIIEVRGVDFDYETEVTLKLVGSQVDVSLGTVVTDVEGIFMENLVLPSDLSEGVYALRATTYHHVILSPTF